jgi:protein phosphatase
MQLLRKIIGLEDAPQAEEQSSLAPDSSTSVEVCKFNVGWMTDVGQVRGHNEDALFVITAACEDDHLAPGFGLFVLGDGMGGHRSGEVASSLAVRTVADHVMERFYLPTLISHEHSTDQPALNEVLIDAVQTANNAVAAEVPGGGTTLTCALMLGTRVYIAHVGDSRAYIFADHQVDQVTHDHSLVDRLVELGELTRDEAAVHPQKNVLYRAVGQEGVLEVDTAVRTLPAGGFLLICCDGLWSLLEDDVMMSILERASSPQDACEALIASANEAGGHDNITAIVVKSPLG